MIRHYLILSFGVIVMEQRKFLFSLQGGGAALSLESAALSFNLSEGYPYLTAQTTNTEQISALMAEQSAGTLINKAFTFNVMLVGVKSIVNLRNLIVGRIAPTETPFGYGASLSLLPRAAAFSTAYPGVFFQKRYNHTVKSLVAAIHADFNSRYPTHKFGNIIFSGANDVVALVPPRFVQIPYFDMIRSVAGFHGLAALIDFDSNLRIFSTLSKNPTLALLGKHNVGSSSMTFDSLQHLAG
jgi:hypothetical protein